MDKHHTGHARVGWPYGVYKVNAVTSELWAIGDKVYFDGHGFTNKVVPGSLHKGIAFEVKPIGSNDGRVGMP
jgi:hypothetical protein